MAREVFSNGSEAISADQRGHIGQKQKEDVSEDVVDVLHMFMIMESRKHDPEDVVDVRIMWLKAPRRCLES